MSKFTGWVITHDNILAMSLIIINCHALIEQMKKDHFEKRLPYKLIE